MKITPNTTRVDVENQGPGCLVRLWEGRWSEGSEPVSQDYLSAVSVFRVLMDLEQQGFTVSQDGGVRGRALRGETTRVDLLKEGDQWVFRKFPYGWTASTRPMAEQVVSDEKAQEILSWMKSKGWTVREFPNGARGWKGPALPIRDARTILRVRRQIEDRFFSGNLDERRKWDLAFDC